MDAAVDRLIDRIIQTNNPTVVGLDPRPEYIPPDILNDAFGQYTDACVAMARAVLTFNQKLIDALCDIVPAVKPQIAFYEIYGGAGMDCYRETVRYAKEKGLITIGDIKRGDIASTAQAYADAHLGRVMVNGKNMPVYDTDFVTINPYLGYDAVAPFITSAWEYSKGVFVLVKNSNASAGDIQDLDTAVGKVYEVVGDLVSAWGTGSAGRYGYSAVGAVVGATYPAQAEALRKRMPDAFFLVPGYGTQGATAEDVRPCFRENGLGAIVNNARGIIAAHRLPAYRGRFTEDNFTAAARQAALDMRAALGYNYEHLTTV
jgi:orotidine-5'-phosphate decarboxylase